MLGSLEKKVVSVLEDKEEATISEILEGLHDEDVEVAYTTVSTVLDRLHDKELVERHKEPYRGGSRYVYEYVDIKDEYVTNVVDNLMTVFGEKGVASLVNNIGEYDDMSEVKDELGMEDEYDEK
ncbi:MAG: BlaI/MecI/CopY family transcriptional regulator [Halobacteria archaeon]|nr:BlaI/MecI/CopY family transcriptional regulator [Halobacteria archaeon]